MTTTDSSSNNNINNNITTMRMIIDNPASNDVLCGKDKTFNRNIGNMIYRQLIIATAPSYVHIKTKPEKMKITAHIVHTMIHEHNSRFLKQVIMKDSSENNNNNNNNNDEEKESSSEYYWQEISITAARDKTSHALRFCASQMRLHKHCHHNNNNTRYNQASLVASQLEPTPDATTSFCNNDDTMKAGTLSIVTPPIERRSIRGRVQRKSTRYSPSQHDRTTTPVKRHRRTVSCENAVPPSPGINIVASPVIVDPQYEYYSPYTQHHHGYYHHHDHHHHNQYYYPYDAERYHNDHYQNESPVTPMECSSAVLPTFHESHFQYNDTTKRRSYDNDTTTTTQYKNDTTDRVACPVYRAVPAKMSVGVKSTTTQCNSDDDDDDDDDDLDAILREPIHWDDDEEEEDSDEDGVGSDDAFEL